MFNRLLDSIYGRDNLGVKDDVMPRMGQIDLTNEVAVIDALLDTLIEESEHDSSIYPSDTDEVVTFTAGGVANTFGAWAEIDVDGDGDTFSSKVATVGQHISGILIEDLSDKDKHYLLEIAYGDDKTIVLRHRFVSGEVKKLAAIQYMRIRAAQIPAGETVYYRMKCETASATCEISLRYHSHTA